MAKQTQRRLALVTGASDGIGYELARQFAAHGYDLVIAAEDAGIVEARQAFEQLGANGVGGAFKHTDLDAELNLIDLNRRSTVHLAKRHFEHSSVEAIARSRRR